MKVETGWIFVDVDTFVGIVEIVTVVEDNGVESSSSFLDSGVGIVVLDKYSELHLVCGDKIEKVVDGSDRGDEKEVNFTSVPRVRESLSLYVGWEEAMSDG
jgi:hypothetical protein